MKENLGFPKEYEDLKISYIDENDKGKRGVLLFHSWTSNMELFMETFNPFWNKK